MAEILAAAGVPVEAAPETQEVAPAFDVVPKAQAVQEEAVMPLVPVK